VHWIYVLFVFVCCSCFPDQSSHQENNGHENGDEKDDDSESALRGLPSAPTSAKSSAARARNNVNAANAMATDNKGGSRSSRTTGGTSTISRAVNDEPEQPCAFRPQSLRADSSGFGVDGGLPVAWSSQVELRTALAEARRVWISSHSVSTASGGEIAASEQLPWAELRHAVCDTVYCTSAIDANRNALATTVFTRYLGADALVDDFAYPSLGPLPFGNRTSITQLERWLQLLHAQSLHGSPPHPHSHDRQHQQIHQQNDAHHSHHQPNQSLILRDDVPLTSALVARLSHAWIDVSPLAFAGQSQGHHSVPLHVTVTRLHVHRCTARAHLDVLRTLFLVDRTQVYAHAEFSFASPWQSCVALCSWCAQLRGRSADEVDMRAQELAATRRAVQRVRAEATPAAVVVAAAASEMAPVYA
jgi:hypothetical protein